MKVFFCRYTIFIFSISSVKICGNGNATKEEMVYLWFKCDKKMEAYKHLKVDDLADAYFLTRYV